MRKHSGAGPDPERWGVSTAYHDVTGARRVPPPETLAAVLAAMGADTNGPQPTRAVAVLRQGATASHATAGPAELRTEDGGSLRLAAATHLPPDLPPGYHDLTDVDDGHTTRLIVSPGSWHLPPGLLSADGRAWGWAIQLYAARSRRSWGIGDLGDLARLLDWSGQQGAAFCLINPLHATRPARQQEPSPYYPASRCFRNPLYLRVEDVPGWSELAAELEPLAAGGRALNDTRRIDRDAVWSLKRAALERLWERVRARRSKPRFETYVREQGEALRAWAAFCTSAEARDGQRGASDREDRVRFHQWLQWLIDDGLSRARARAGGASAALVNDLAVGCDPDGADPRLWPDCYSLGVSIGAPPDDFNADGQDWGLAPFDPWRLRAAAYEPFIRAVRAAFAHAGGVRLDHVMGLFRLFWVPAGAPPSAGTYVRYPAADLLDIVALESQRTSAWVVGEDLGTVEDEVRAELARRGVLSSRVLWFEDRPPAEYPARALATVTTHDLPTVAGLWSGRDRWIAHRDLLVGRVRRLLGVDETAPAGEVALGLYRALARSPCALVAATLEDALGVEERPNVPGTTPDDHPNWSLALPLPLEEIEAHPGPAAFAEALAPRSTGSC